MGLLWGPALAMMLMVLFVLRSKDDVDSDIKLVQSLNSI